MKCHDRREFSKFSLSLELGWGSGLPPQYGVIELIIFRPGAKFVKIYVSFFDMHLVTLRWPPYQIISDQVLICSRYTLY